MRHSDPSLTANVYTDPKLLDVAGALDALPSLPLDTGQTPIPEQARATGTETYGRFAVALPVALTDDKPGKTVANADNATPPTPIRLEGSQLDANLDFDKGKETLTRDDKRSAEWAMRDSNPRHPACKAGIRLWIS
jgi:hypothetical protein